MRGGWIASQTGRRMRDVHHEHNLLPKLPLDIAIVRESIHKRTEYEATCPLTQRRRRNSVAPISVKHLALNRHAGFPDQHGGDESRRTATKPHEQGVLPPWTGAM